MADKEGRLGALAQIDAKELVGATLRADCEWSNYF